MVVVVVVVDGGGEGRKGWGEGFIKVKSLYGERWGVRDEKTVSGCRGYDLRRAGGWGWKGKGLA